MKTNRRSVKSGLPPGSLVHIGKISTESPLFQVIRYNEGNAEEILVSGISDLKPFLKQKESNFWVDVIGLNHLEMIEEIGKMFNIHPLALEDIVNTEQRPKYEEYNDFFFVTLKTLDVSGELCKVNYGQISIFCGVNFIITFQEEDKKLFNTVQKRLLSGVSRARTRKVDFLFYLLADYIVDSYFPVIEQFADTVDEMEAKIIKEVKSNSIQDLQTIRKNFSTLLRQLYPLREAIARIEKKENELMTDETRLYFRDIYDHIIHLSETVENLREILSGTVEIALASMNNKLNSVMKVLTVIATIFIPLSFLASVYGMNFRYFPELQWKYGYFSFWVVVVLIVALMFYFFRKNKWM